MSGTCKQCGGGFEISEGDLGLYKKIAPRFNDVVFDFPLPDLCADCRQMKRLAFRNEKTLYKRKCDLRGDSIVATFHKDVPWPVYGQEAFWSDGWDVLEFGRDFDFGRPFFEQFGELMKVVPRLALVNKQSENSEYCNYAFANKNCYLLFGAHYEEDCLYGSYATKNKDCVDYFWLYESELCYECTFSGNLYRCFYLDRCYDCSDCMFSFDLKGCQHCLFSSNLRNKRYFIFNKEHSKEEYEDYVGKLGLGDYAHVKKLREGWDKFMRDNVIYRANYQVNCEDCDGSVLQNSKNLKYCFSCSDCEDCAYGFQMDESYTCIDNSHLGYDRCELSYNTIGCNGTYHCICCDSCWHSSDLIYCNQCFSSRNCFGCVGLRNKEYCIFNKQYSKEMYDAMVARIIEHMRGTAAEAGCSTGEWGLFFPYEIHPYAYNESVVMEFFPLEKEEALGVGARWRDGGQEMVGDFVGDAINCEISGKPFRLTGKEIDFYRKMGLPAVPGLSPAERLKGRLERRNPFVLFGRKCSKCGVAVNGVYEAERSEKVFCEECYLGEVR